MKLLRKSLLLIVAWGLWDILALDMHYGRMDF